MDNISDSCIFNKKKNDLRQNVENSELDFIKYNIGSTNKVTILDAKDDAFFNKLGSMKKSDHKRPQNVKQI